MRTMLTIWSDGIARAQPTSVGQGSLGEPAEAHNEASHPLAPLCASDGAVGEAVSTPKMRRLWLHGARSWGKVRVRTRGGARALLFGAVGSGGGRCRGLRPAAISHRH